MISKEFDLIVQRTGDLPVFRMICLHGLGAQKSDLTGVVPFMISREMPNIEFVFPQAPEMPITINSGMNMPAWYDIRTPAVTTEPDLEGMQNSSDFISDLMENLNSRYDIPMENTILMGFSQGGLIALHNFLTKKHTLMGCIALSTYLPVEKADQIGFTESNKNQPILMQHGMMDEVVSVIEGRQTRDYLVHKGFNVGWKEYPIGHEISHESLRDIKNWLINTLDFC